MLERTISMCLLFFIMGAANQQACSAYHGQGPRRGDHGDGIVDRLGRRRVVNDVAVEGKGIARHRVTNRAGIERNAVDIEAAARKGVRERGGALAVCAGKYKRVTTGYGACARGVGPIVRVYPIRRRRAQGVRARPRISRRKRLGIETKESEERQCCR